MSQAHHRQCSAGAFTSHWGTHADPHALCSSTDLPLPWQCWLGLTRMQFCRRVLCQPCSARVTSPEEDMEYKMGSCIGISRRQVNGGEVARWAECSCSVSIEARSGGGGIQEQPGRLGGRREREGRFYSSAGGGVAQHQKSALQRLQGANDADCMFPGDG